MPTPRLPGLSTIVALMLTAAIASALVITGPIPVKYEVAKDFQPLIAAVLALVGASIIFRGAKLNYKASMEKIDLDRKHEEQRIERRRRAFFMRMRFAAFVLRRDSNKLLAEPKLYSSLVFQKDEVRFDTAEEVQEIWPHLDAFPRDVAVMIGNIQMQLFNVQRAARSMVADYSIQQMNNPHAEFELRQGLIHLSETSQFIDEALGKLLLEMTDL
jgi:hypothetical protein